MAIIGKATTATAQGSARPRSSRSRSRPPMQLTHVAQRVFGVPLMIHPPKLEIILKAIGPRLVADPGLWSDDLVNQLRGLGAISPVRASQSPSTARTPNSYYVTESGVAVIPIQGTLMKRASGLMAISGCSTYENIAASLECAVLDNSEVKAVLLDIDSPGGETHGCFELSDLIYSLRSRKPIWSSANDMAASAAYAIASATSRVYVTRTGSVGSIGIVSCHCDQSEADSKAGLKFTYIHAGARKIDGNEHEPLAGKAKSIWKAEIDRQYAIFTETVARNRKMSNDAVTGTEAGVFYAENGVEAGLADKVGTFEEALADLEAKVGPKGSSLDRVGRRTAVTVPRRMAAIAIPSGLRVAAGAAQIRRVGASGAILSSLLPSVQSVLNQGETMAQAKKSKQALAAEQKTAADKKARIKTKARMAAKALADARALVAAADAAELEADAETDDLETGADADEIQVDSEGNAIDTGAAAEYMDEDAEAEEAEADAAVDPDCPKGEAEKAEADAAVPNDDDEDDMPKAKKKAKASAANVVPGRVAQFQPSGQSPQALIAEACDLAGMSSLAGKFIRKFDAGSITVKGVRNYLLDKRAEKSRATTVTGAIAPAGTTKLDVLENQATSLAANSNGKLTRAQAYTQLLTRNPGAYAAYVRERNFGVRNEMAAEKYLSMLGQRFPTGVIS